MKAITIPALGILLLTAGCGSHYPEGPCDIYAQYGTPAVTAHSTTRVLYSKYSGPLYQIRRQSDGKTLDIYPDKDGIAQASAQDMFLKDDLGYITIIYDQSGLGNDLLQAPPGTFKGPDEGNFNTLPIAHMAPVTVRGRKAYGTYIMPGMGLRANNARGLAIDDEPEGIYYVVDGTHYDNGCCFDYGNSSTNGRAVGTGTMETTYYGTSTNWGSGLGNGPWIMADMEGGLFSGYDPKVNPVPSIDSWRFVSVYVNGGGGNKWELHGADATGKEITTYYRGIRPLSETNDSYYPMHKKGGMLLGNGGDNGNGSAGTFYEGVMTVGFPTEEAIIKVQENIAQAGYAVPFVELSRLTTFTPGASLDFNVTFNNSTSAKASHVKVSLNLPDGWKAEPKNGSEVIASVGAGESAGVSYFITAPAQMSAGFVTATVDWGSGCSSASQRIRAAVPVKINEIALTDKQFIELYNNSGQEIDLSGMQIGITRSGQTAVTPINIQQGISIKPYGFLVFSEADGCIMTSASVSDKTLYMSGSAELANAESIFIGGKEHSVKQVSGLADAQPTTIFIPVSTGPWLNFEPGCTNLPLTSVAGFHEGAMAGIDLGGNYEVVTITQVGTPATQTNTAEPLQKGQTIIKLDATDQLSEGDLLTIGTGDKKECIKIKRVISRVAAPGRYQKSEPGEVELEKPISIDQISGVDVSCPGSGITFTPALKYAHKSGQGVQALGSGVVLAEALGTSADLFDPVTIKKPDSSVSIPFGYRMSESAGAVALYSADGKVLIDAIVYGSQQSNSSANGTIARPDIATLEGIQTGGGSIAIVPQRPMRGFGGFGGFGGGAPRGGVGANAAPAATPAVPAQQSIARLRDGADTDRLSEDFHTLQESTPGKPNK